MINKLHQYEKQAGPFVIALAIIGLSVGGYFYYQIAEGIVSNTAALEGTVLDLQEENITLQSELKREKAKNQMFGEQIGEIVQTVGTLDKLSKTDKELLQKYSKVYFLNEHYVPDSLTDIPPDYLLQLERKTQMHAGAYPYLQELIVAAKDAGFDLKVVSAYRSFGDQISLKGNYTVTYGSGANKFSADQGYSEHQLGTTIDFTNTQIGANYTDFGDTQSYQWLLDNAYKYGFTLSYPEGNQYYQFEPWHWRFVGKALANYLHNENLNFYDVPQTKIDAYLINIFD